MKVCGFSFVRNAVKFGYPVVESITSVLPVCDLFVIAVGNSDDGTLELIRSIPSDKIKIVETTWDDSLREGGRVLAVETDKAFDEIPEEYDWCFYIQADEVVHEKYHQVVREMMEHYLDQPGVEGLLFNYLHFYGSFQYVGDSRQWYRREIRVIRNDKRVRSYRDAQGFRKEGRKLTVKHIPAYIYHYGWVRPPRVMREKMVNFSSLYHAPETVKKMFAENELIDYSKVDSISYFRETHPKVMLERVKALDWDPGLDVNKKNFKLKDRLLHLFEKFTGYRLFEYKNYRII